MEGFASILKAEIASKKAPPKSSTSTSTSTTTQPTKYLKRSEIEAARQAEYLTSQQRLEAGRREKANKKRKLDEEAALARERTLEKKQKLREEKDKAKREGDEQAKDERQIKQALKSGAMEEEQAMEQLDEDTVIERLRELGEPAKLYGESHLQRLKRLHLILHPPASPTAKPAIERPVTPPPLSGGELLIIPTDVTSNQTLVYRQLLGWFNLVISEWGSALADREMELKESYQGKQATGAMKQAVEYMQPLFRHLKRMDLDEEIFGRVVELVVEAQARRYVKANDIYLKLSIGNAAWPIGVTMVGIHERSAREKLHEKGKSAHIMSDEATRKYLQSIKRCLNFAQTRWPPEDAMQIMG